MDPYTDCSTVLRPQDWKKATCIKANYLYKFSYSPDIIPVLDSAKKVPGHLKKFNFHKNASY